MLLLLSITEVQGESGAHRVQTLQAGPFLLRFLRQLRRVHIRTFWRRGGAAREVPISPHPQQGHHGSERRVRYWGRSKVIIWPRDDLYWVIAASHVSDAHFWFCWRPCHTKPLLAQFSLYAYVHKGGIKPHSFHFTQSLSRCRTGSFICLFIQLFINHTKYMWIH